MGGWTEAPTPHRNMDPGSSALNQLVHDSTMTHRPNAPRVVTRAIQTLHPTLRVSHRRRRVTIGGPGACSWQLFVTAGLGILAYASKSRPCPCSSAPRTSELTDTKTDQLYSHFRGTVAPRVYSTFSLLSIRLFLELTASFTLLAK